ncbi:FadR/GntR family transcriptional regulator [Microlunatus soli]|uniref:FCD domain-containing protein n=1 Tax=Microlunatus soli TaxID=630515 RepID=A0A1H1YAH1_9ACTN|nr:FCD domain-containing protein [Microlunatus soli]SDT18259.1 FCD domain-containing protein [Microlunatus soli]
MTVTDPLDELLPDEVVLVMAIGESPHPVGARLALRALTEAGVRSSEASVSRMLGKLDGLGLTTQVGRKGRVLTPHGRAVVQARRSRARRSESFERALELRTVAEVLDWLRARRAIESEAAYLAALRVQPEMVDRMGEAVAAHEHAAQVGRLGFRIVGMDFHRLLAEAADSPVFQALIESLIAPRAVAVEQTLDMILAARGTIADSADDHRRLLAAITAKSPDAARTLMHDHLARMEREVEQFSQETNNLLTSALGLVDDSVGVN